MQDLRHIGKSVPRLDVEEKITGRARFGSDFMMSGLLQAKVLRSPLPHARVIRMDISKAKRLPGVRAVLTPDDVPQVSISPLFADQFALCRDNLVRSVGEPVAAVAADTIDIAEEAAADIVVEYEALPAVFNVEEAFEEAPPVVIWPDMYGYEALSGLPIRPDPKRPNVPQTYKIRVGDVEKGFQDAHLIVENRFTTARLQHAPLETHQADAWFEADGGLVVRSSGQMTNEVKERLCKLFQLSPSKVRLLSTYLGGTFGNKVGIRAEAIAALLARKARRPVRLVFTRQEMFLFGGHRPPYIIDIKDGVKKDGTISAREMRVLLDIGVYSEHGVLLVRRAAPGAIGTYRIPNFKLGVYGVYTNSPLTCAFRGFGSAEIEWAIEQQMDILAHELGLDPVEIRKKNVLKAGDRDGSGMTIGSIGVQECLNEVRHWIGWEAESRQDSGPWKRGKGLAMGNKSVMAGSTSVVLVKVWQDGTVEVRHSAAEVGQGIKTTLAQIAAEEFGVAPGLIKVSSGDTGFCPYDFGTCASRSLIHNGNALIDACRKVKEKLFSMAAPKLLADPAELMTGDGLICVTQAPERSIGITALFTTKGFPEEGGEILAAGSYTAPSDPEDPDTGQSRRSVFDYSYTANAVEVAVNVETGEIKVLKSGLACDVGKAINPGIVEGQIEGAIAMGAGTTIFEDIIMENGAVLNTSFTDYHIPTTLDLPLLKDSKAFIVEALEAEGPYGAKGAGEVPMIATAPAIANAVYQAVGVRMRDLPLTAEKVLAAIKELETKKDPDPR